MPIYVFENAQGERIEQMHPISAIPDVVRVGGRRYRRVQAVNHGHSMPVESSARYNAWFHSDSTQAKLRSGEYEILPKSADANHL